MARKNRRWRNILVGWAIGLAAVVAVLYFTWYRDWMAMPAVAEEAGQPTWADLESWAEPARGVGDPSRLLDAQHRVDALPAVERDSAEAPLPAIDPTSLPKRARAALASLTAWSREGGGFVRSPCGSTSPAAGREAPRAQPLLRLARVALATSAERPDTPKVRAVARLSGALRGAGSLLDGVIGLVIWGELARWLHSRDLQPPAWLDEHAPDPQELVALLARETVCVLDTFASMPGREASVLGLARWDDVWVEEPRPPLDIVRVERELRLARSYYATRLHRVREVASDPDRSVREIQKMLEDAGRTHGVLLRLVLPVRAAHTARSWYEELRRSNATLQVAGRADSGVPEAR